MDADGWKTWPMQDVSTAVYHAYRKSYLRPEQYMSRFLEKLEGKELTSAGHLSVRDISFAEEISEIDSLLDFYMETNFDVDAVFGTHVCTGENDDTLNVYANYDMASGQVCDELEVDLHRADGREEPVEYRLNAVEKATLLRKMDAYCQGQTGQTLKAGFFLCILVDGSNGNIQLGEAGAHGLDAQPVLLRGFRWNADGIVKTQFHSGDVVLGGAGAQRA